MIARVLMATLVALSLSTAPRVGWAQPDPSSDTDRAAARELGENAVTAYQAGEFAKAYDLFKRAHAIVGLTTTGLYMARCLVTLNRFVEASERYVEVTRMPLPPDAQEIHAEAKTTAAEEREDLLPRIPKLLVKLSGADLEGVVVTLDGIAVPPALLGVERPVDPGDHVVVASRETPLKEERVTLAEGESRTIVLNLGAAALPPPPPPPPPPGEVAAADGSLLHTLGWVAIGVGGAGLVVGAITGGLALDKRSSLEKACPNKQCTPQNHGDVDSYQTLRIVSGVGLIAGGALAAAGIVLLIVAPSAAEPAVSLGVTPMGFSLTGTF